MKTPWRIGKHCYQADYDDKLLGVAIVNADNQRVLKQYIDKDIAAHIVHCVNAHDALQAKAALVDEAVEIIGYMQSALDPGYLMDEQNQQVDSILARALQASGVADHEPT